VPVTVLPEVAYLLRSRLGVEVERRFVSSLAQHELVIEGLATPDLDRCRVLLDRYPGLGFVDASVVAIAERLRLPAIVTTDRRHFGQVRPAHRTAFELLP
jgi:predicted nucleic acid-binding protein